MMRILFIFVFVSVSTLGARIKDIATLKGARDNQLWGYGVVVGLAGTGDRDLSLTDNSLNMVLKGLGVDVGSEQIKSRNAAAVVVSATLPAFAGVGTRFDIQVASIGSATTLENGTLLLTPLKSADGEVYAMAQGKVFNPKSSRRRGAVRRNQRTVSGEVPNGALLEKEVPLDFNEMKSITFQLRHPDFTTATRMAIQINRELGVRVAEPISAGAVEINYPPGYRETPVAMVARVESLEIETDQKAKVILNRNTGTVVLGSRVRIRPVAIAHNNLKIEIKKPELPGREVSGLEQGGLPLLDNENPVSSPVDGLQRPGQERERHKVVLLDGATVAQVAESLNQLGASPQDLIAIFHSLRKSGALDAEIHID